ncbi:MAG: hypothetical protein P1T08_11980 [Acidimicrobiia bacterium]|nr:hypothetical protein [Acidimicrobiia bacterium]
MASATGSTIPQRTSSLDQTVAGQPQGESEILHRTAVSSDMQVTVGTIMNMAAAPTASAHPNTFLDRPETQAPI